MCGLFKRFWGWCCASRVREVHDELRSKVREEVHDFRNLAQAVIATQRSARKQSGEINRSARRVIVRMERLRRAQDEHHDQPPPLA